MRKMKFFMKNYLFFLILIIILQSFLCFNGKLQAKLSELKKNLSAGSPKLFYEGWLKVSSHRFFVFIICLFLFFMEKKLIQDKKLYPPIPHSKGETTLTFLKNHTSFYNLFHEYSKKYKKISLKMHCTIFQFKEAPQQKTHSISGLSTIICITHRHSMT